MDPHLAIGRVIAHDYGNSQVLDRLTSERASDRETACTGRWASCAEGSCPGSRRLQCARKGISCSQASRLGWITAGAAGPHALTTNGLILRNKPISGLRSRLSLL